MGLYRNLHLLSGIFALLVPLHSVQANSQNCHREVLNGLYQNGKLVRYISLQSEPNRAPRYVATSQALKNMLGIDSDRRLLVIDDNNELRFLPNMPHQIDLLLIMKDRAHLDMGRLSLILSSAQRSGIRLFILWVGDQDGDSIPWVSALGLAASQTGGKLFNNSGFDQACASL